MEENLQKTEFKESLGEVNTPYKLADQMISLFPEDFLMNPKNTWLDPGCGSGNISWRLFNRLIQYHNPKHILEEMLHMVEINKEREMGVRSIFKSYSDNLILSITDFLKWTPEKEIDAIICNPPYNFNGVIKTPTNNNIEKKDDGANAWCQFVHHSLNIVKPGGYMCFIVPAIWLKPDDKAGMYNLLTSYNILKLHCFSASETNKLFKGLGQTPTTIFFLKKEQPTIQRFSLYCQKEERYFNFDYSLKPPIPMCNIVLINKMLYRIKESGYIKVTKTNMPPKHVEFSPFETDKFKFKNIKTVTQVKGDISKGENIFDSMEGTMKGEKIITWSNSPCIGYGHPKIILAHKMYGLPFLDLLGEYGVSNRDNYIISGTDYSLEELERIYNLLCCPVILDIYNSTRYRMRYLEKYAFRFIPDITKITELNSKEINNKSIKKYFDI